MMTVEDINRIFEELEEQRAAEVATQQQHETKLRDDAQLEEKMA